MHGLLRPELKMNRIHFPQTLLAKQVRSSTKFRRQGTDTISSWEELQSHIAKGHGFTEGRNPDPFCKISNVAVFRDGPLFLCYSFPFLCFPSPVLFNASLSLYGFLLLCSATVSSETIWSIRFYTATSLSV